MSEEIIVRYYFVGGGHLDCEYTDEEMYHISLQTFIEGGLLIFDNMVINTKNVTNSQIIKGSVMDID